MADALIQLQTRGVDAVPTLPLMALAGQFHTVTKHMLELNGRRSSGRPSSRSRRGTACRRRMRDELLKIAADNGNRMREASRQENEQAVAVMQAKSGLQVHAVSAALEAEWRQFAEAIYPRLRGSMVPAEMFDRARQRVAEYRAARR
jgi:TRAP-type C4-dicarboxylate transport system substrate-binding protein